MSFLSSLARRAGLAVGLASALALTAAAAHAAELIVDPNGINGEYPTLQAALAAAAADDTITLRAGDHYVDFVGNIGAVLDKPGLTVRGDPTQPREAVVLRVGTTSNSTSPRMLSIRASLVAVHNLTIKGSSSAIFLGDGQADNKTFDLISVTNVHFEDTAYYGVTVHNTNTATNLQVQDCLFIRSGSRGIRTASTGSMVNAVIERCEFREYFDRNDGSPSGTWGIVIENGSGNVVRDCQFRDLSPATNSTGGVGLVNTTGGIVDECSFERLSRGVTSSKGAASITGCIFSDVREVAVRLNATAGLAGSFVVDNNTISVDASALTADGSAIDIRIAAGQPTVGAARILNNEITVQGSLNAAVTEYAAIEVRGTFDGVQVTGNTFQSTAVTSVTQATRGLVVRSADATPWGTPPSGSLMTVENNLFDGFTSAVRVMDYSVTPAVLGGLPAGAELVLSENDLSGCAVGVENGSAAPAVAVSNPVDARRNWWGQETGPVAGQVVGGVINSPWIVAYVQDPSPVGFYPLDVVEGPVSTSLVYTGVFVDADGGSSTALMAQLSVPMFPECAAGQAITFTVTSLGAAVPSATLTATTDASGKATATWSYSTVPTGVYTVVASFAGDALCLGSTAEEAELTIALPGSSAFGGGWYKATLSPTSKASFGFVAQKKTNKRTGEVTFSGQMAWTHHKNHRIKSVSIDGVTQETPPEGYSRAARVFGTGLLSTWVPDSSLLEGGYWSTPQTVQFVAMVLDGGTVTTTVKKQKFSSDRPDAFGMQVSGVTLPGETVPVQLGGGSIKIN